MPLCLLPPDLGHLSFPRASSITDETIFHRPVMALAFVSVTCHMKSLHFSHGLHLMKPQKTLCLFYLRLNFSTVSTSVGVRIWKMK